MDLQINTGGVRPFIDDKHCSGMQEEASGAYNTLVKGSGKGNDFLGWKDLPVQTDTSLVQSLNETTQRLRAIAEVCVVIGIGGSYLGARAVIEALKHAFSAMMDDRTAPEIIYAGHQLSADYMADLLDLLNRKEYAVIVISKSGTTTEPALAFRLLKEHMEKKYGKSAFRERIVAITDRKKGVLKQLADAEGYDRFIVPDDVGGRFSVLSPVGLLPIAVSGFDIGKLLQGAAAMRKDLLADTNPASNMAMQYAIARNACYRSGFLTEVMVNYEPRLNYITEWWKQLYGESEGKEGKGIFPAGVTFTTDLHSMGQYLQDGERRLFETVLSVEKPVREISIPADASDADGLNFIAGRGLSTVNHSAAKGTMIAHRDGGVPQIAIHLPCIDEERLGQLLYFFEFACGVSAYMIGVNPFDQPGVEAYKKNMFALLGKPGFEELRSSLLSRMAGDEG